jgi:2-polyprenyl-3-methyl-5-hydroxy-6-metoxy-1,4-benzoquinol methylase
VRRWWATEGLCDIERVYFEAVRSSPSLLDVGAGDLRIMRKLERAGYRGEYHTQDVGTEGTYTYRDLEEIPRSYGAILCLDVIEHLPLREGLTMVRRMVSLLEPGGVVVIQTPNAAYLPDPRSWDMTHLHVYNAGDLWAYLKCEGLEVDLYRVALRDEHPGPVVSARLMITDYVKRRILGCDYANNIAAIGRRPA